MRKIGELRFCFDGGYGRSECDFCGKKYDDHGVSIELQAEGQDGSDGFWAGGICGNCLTPDPRDLARVAREQVKVLRRKKDHLKKDLNIYHADGMMAVAGVLDGIADYSPIGSGIVAVKIAEAYREINAANRKKKAA